MAVDFNKNSYLVAINIETSLQDERALKNYIRENPQYQYGKVTFEQFSANYSAEGALTRKIVALPLAIWSGLVLSIYHFAKALFMGIAQTFADTKKSNQANVYAISRDFQEALGRLTSIFNDQYGSYLIQESQFHKSCYDYFASNSSSPIEDDPILANSRKNYQDKMIRRTQFEGLDSAKIARANERNLLNFKTYRKSNDAFIYITVRNQFNDIIKDVTIPEENRKLFIEMDKDWNLPENVLDLLTVGDLLIPQEFSPFKFANKDTISSLKISDLAGQKLEPIQINFIRKLCKIRENARQAPMDINQFDDSITLNQLLDASKESIAQNLESIPPLAFAFFSNDQIEGLKLAHLSSKQCMYLFNFLSPDEVQDRLLLFDAEDVVEAIRLDKISQQVYEYLSNSHFQVLKISQLSESLIKNIFPKNAFEKKAYFDSINPKELQILFEENKVDVDYLPSWTTGPQLAKMQVSKFSQFTIACMFMGGGDEKLKAENRQRFAYISSEEVLKLFEKYHPHIFPGSCVEFLSDVHLQYIQTHNSALGKRITDYLAKT